MMEMTNEIAAYRDQLLAQVHRGMQQLSIEMERTAVDAESRHKTYNLRNSIASGTEVTESGVVSRVFGGASYTIYQEEGSSKFRVPYPGLHFLKGALDRGCQIAIGLIERAR
jgi:hypothetical protein